MHGQNHIKLRFLSCPSVSLVTTPNEISRIILEWSYYIFSFKTDRAKGDVIGHNDLWLGRGGGNFCWKIGDMDKSLRGENMALTTLNHTLLSITNKMQRYTIFFIIVNVLHVSGGFSAHHQELKNCTHSIGYMSSLLAASGSSKQTWRIPDTVWTVFELLMMGGETAWNMYSSVSQTFFKWGPLSLVRMFYGPPYSWDYQTQ